MSLNLLWNHPEPHRFLTERKVSLNIASYLCRWEQQIKRHRSPEDKTEFHFAMCATGEGMTAPAAHHKTIQQKFQTTQRRLRTGNFQVIRSWFSNAGNECSHVAPLPRVTCSRWWLLLNIRPRGELEVIEQYNNNIKNKISFVIHIS